MTPAPTIQHQEVVGALYRIFGNYLQGKNFRVFIAPLDVLLAEGQEPDEQIKTVVQPDVFVVCDKTKLDKRRSKGAPDLIIDSLKGSSTQEVSCKSHLTSFKFNLCLTNSFQGNLLFMIEYR
jgi:hypothetical protein